MKKCIFLILILLTGYLTREFSIKVPCSKCNKSSHTRYVRRWQDLKCDSCGFYYPVEEHNTLGITYYKINNVMLKEDINHYQ